VNIRLYNSNTGAPLGLISQFISVSTNRPLSDVGEMTFELSPDVAALWRRWLSQPFACTVAFEEDNGRSLWEGAVVKYRSTAGGTVSFTAREWPELLRLTWSVEKILSGGPPPPQPPEILGVVDAVESRFAGAWANQPPDKIPDLGFDASAADRAIETAEGFEFLPWESIDYQWNGSSYDETGRTIESGVQFFDEELRSTVESGWSWRSHWVADYAGSGSRLIVTVMSDETARTQTPIPVVLDDTVSYEESLDFDPSASKVVVTAWGESRVVDRLPQPPEGPDPVGRLRAWKPFSYELRATEPSTAQGLDDALDAQGTALLDRLYIPPLLVERVEFVGIRGEYRPGDLIRLDRFEAWNFVSGGSEPPPLVYRVAGVSHRASDGSQSTTLDLVELTAITAPGGRAASPIAAAPSRDLGRLLKGFNRRIERLEGKTETL